jgi:hypothetical protein
MSRQAPPKLTTPAATRSHVGRPGREDKKGTEGQLDRGGPLGLPPLVVEVVSVLVVEVVWARVVEVVWARVVEVVWAPFPGMGNGHSGTPS